MNDIENWFMQVGFATDKSVHKEVNIAYKLFRHFYFCIFG